MLAKNTWPLRQCHPKKTVVFQLLLFYMSQGRSTPCIGDKLIQPLIGNPYFMGIFSPLRTWVDELMSLSPIIWKCHGS